MGDVGEPQVADLDIDAHFLSDFTRGRSRQGFASVDFARGKVPLAVEQATSTLREEKFTLAQ